MGRIFEGSRWINRFMAVAILVVGAIGIGLQAPWLTDRNMYAAYTSMVNAAIGVQTVGTSLDLAVAGAAITIVAGVIALGSTLAKPNIMRIAFIAACVLSMIGGIIELAGGLVVMNSNYYAKLGPDTYVFNEANAGEQLDGDKEKMAMMGLAIFDQCCRPPEWVSQGQFANCSIACPTAQSGNLTNPLIQKVQDVIPPATIAKLCTCVRSESATTYQTAFSAINTDACSNLQKFRVSFIEDIEIPTTGVSIGFVKNRLFATSVISKVPLIGWHLDAPSDPTHQTADGFGFGCGLGYPKGIMWIQELYHQQFIQTGGSTALGLGIASIAVPILAFIIGYFLSREDDDSAAGGNWENTLAAKWNDPVAAAPVATVASTPATVAKVENASAWSSSNPMSTVSDPTLDSLIKFYAKHDPLKSRKEIDGIAQYAKQNGLPALNKKLKDKYGVDLSGGDAGPPI